MNEIDGVPVELRPEIADQTARGPLAVSIRDYLERNPGGGWEVLRGMLAREYFSRDYAVSVQTGSRTSSYPTSFTGLGGWRTLHTLLEQQAPLKPTRLSCTAWPTH